MPFTQTPIPGRQLQNVLPAGTALILEGGGLRSYYSSGVMEAFLEKDILFPYIIGVSAGAANALSYISGQPMRSRQIIEHYVGSPEYVSKRNFLKTGSMFGFDYIFRTVPEQHIQFDWEAYKAQKTRFLTGAMNCVDGKTVWFEKEEITPPFAATMASCSVPILTKIQHFKDYDLLDGGITDPIPIEKSIADGNRFHVVVLTRNAGYRKEPFGHESFLRVVFRKYPAVADAMLRRHEIYNRQLDLCERLEREGKAAIIRPLEPIRVGRTSADIPSLLALHDEGVREGRAALPRIFSGLQIPQVQSSDALSAPV